MNVRHESSIISPKKGILHPLKDNKFCFSCHPDISCFTECCHDLHLILTPYDILRLRYSLGISSDELIDKYTTIVLRPGTLPEIRLKMEENKDKPCPFLSKEGCEVYPDRPSACRIYPIARASSRTVEKKDRKEKFFLVREEHCMGFKEDKEWTISEWLQNQGIIEYDKYNEYWFQLVSLLGQTNKAINPAQLKMYIMATYNIDRFRKFIFETKFLHLFDIPKERINLIKTNDKKGDQALLKLAIDWLMFAFFGKETIPLKEEVKKEKERSIAVGKL